jgi:hypothetical protein
MRLNIPRSAKTAVRTAALLGTVVLGLVAIVGSGGGVDAPQCSFFSNVCNPVIDFPPVLGPLLALAFPFKLAQQAGAPATFTAQVSGIDQPRYQWQRSADGGVTYTDVVGATASLFTLASTQFADDGAVFRVQVRGSGGDTVQASSNAVALLVSSQAAVLIEDGDFQVTGWSVSAIADPAQNGPTHSEDRSASGGLPGAFRHMVHTLTAGPSSLRVFNTQASLSYDPQAQGAVHAIDYREDCNRLSASTPSLDILSFPTLEQAGRRYVSSRGRGCLSSWVGNFDPLPSLQATDFTQLDGPACGSGESCPDFSAGGAPLRFGFERRASLQAGAPAGSIEHGIDNWKISIWRP